MTSKSKELGYMLGKDLFKAFYILITQIILKNLQLRDSEIAQWIKEVTYCQG